MKFSEAIKACFSKYATFSGRAGRPEYWWFFLFVFLGSFILSGLDAAIFGFDAETGRPTRVFSGIFGLAIILPMLAVGWRRLHDIGKPGWYLLTPLMLAFIYFLALLAGVISVGVIENAGVDQETLRGPAALLTSTGSIFFGFIYMILVAWLIWLLTRPSQAETNEYGPPPTQ